MGGDGGTAASNRRYMRGVSTALPAYVRRARNSADGAPGWKACRLSGGPLSDGNVVADDLGRLYDREAAVAQLLRRARGAGGKQREDPMAHVRGLRDLYDVRPEGGIGAPMCSATAAALSEGGTGSERAAAPSIPCYVVVRIHGRKAKSGAEGASENDTTIGGVLSGKAIRELGMDGLRSLGYDFGVGEPLMTDEVDYIRGERGDTVETASMRLVRLFPPEAGSEGRRESSVQLRRMDEWRVARREREDAEARRRKEDKKRNKKKRVVGVEGGGDVKEKKRKARETAPSTGMAAGSAVAVSVGCASGVAPSVVVEAARAAVARATAGSSVFSSIFTPTEGGISGRSEGERKIKLFTTNGR